MVPFLRPSFPDPPAIIKWKDLSKALNPFLNPFFAGTQDLTDNTLQLFVMPTEFGIAHRKRRQVSENKISALITFAGHVKSAFCKFDAL